MKYSCNDGVWDGWDAFHLQVGINNATLVPEAEAASFYCQVSPLHRINTRNGEIICLQTLGMKYLLLDLGGRDCHRFQRVGTWWFKKIKEREKALFLSDQHNEKCLYMYQCNFEKWVRYLFIYLIHTSTVYMSIMKLKEILLLQLKANHFYCGIIIFRGR